MGKSISKEIGEIYQSGITSADKIYEELKKRGRICKKSTVSSYLTVIKSQRSVDNNVPSSNSNSQSSNSNNNNIRHVQETSQSMESKTQTQSQQEIKTENIESNLQGNNEGQNNQTSQLPNSENGTNPIIPNQDSYNQPIKQTDQQLITSSNKFSLESIQADNQPESSIMSKSYSDDFKPPVDPDKKMIPVKLHRIGSFNGEITQAIMSSDRIKKATNGYEMSDEEIKMINEDTEEVLKNRLKLIDSEYGDFINLGLGYLNLLLKTISHKIRNPKVKEYIEKEAEKVENEIIDQIEKGKKDLKTEAGEIIQVEKLDKIQDENILCQSCNEKKIYQHGMCKACFFKAEILKGQKAFDGT